MKKQVISAVVIALCGMMLSCQNKQEQVSDPTDDSSQFVTLTDVVPDVILEIRYFGTYNFVGETALTVIWSLPRYLPRWPLTV